MSRESDTLRSIFEYLGHDMADAENAELRTYLERYAGGVVMENTTLRAKLAEAKGIFHELVEEDICGFCGEETKKKCLADSDGEGCGGYQSRQAARKFCGMPELEREE